MRAEAVLAAGPVFIPVTVILELELELERVRRSRDGFASKLVAQAIEKIASLENVLVGEREAVLVAAAKASHGWDFADALHHALS